MKNIKRLFTISLLVVWSLPSLAVIAGPDEQASKLGDDVVASVGDQPITFSELNTMLNSSAIVGLSIPELGSPQRDQVRLTLLDKVISCKPDLSGCGEKRCGQWTRATRTICSAFRTVCSPWRTSGVISAATSR